MIWETVRLAIQAIVLSLMGGTLGSILGLGLATFASMLMSILFTPDPLVVLRAFAFSAFADVIFGYFPARAAARLDPTRALRHK